MLLNDNLSVILQKTQSAGRAIYSTIILVKKMLRSKEIQYAFSRLDYSILLVK
jgi:hypothetical protein